MLLTSFVVLYILIFRARRKVRRNLRIRKRTASFKVAQLSWILTSIETILRLVGLFHFRSHALAERNPDISYWLAIAVYHMALLGQTTFQIWCLREYEKNTRSRCEGPSWMITRKSFLIIMAFMNCYMWVLNVAGVRILVDLTSDKMEELLSGSVERIIYTANRASTLAYHVESVQLFYKFYEEDKELLAQQEYENLDNQNVGGNTTVETDSTKGKCVGFIMFVVFVSMAGGSFLVRTKMTDSHIAATAAIIGILLTIVCITLKTTQQGNSQVLIVGMLQTQDNHDSQQNNLVNEVQHRSVKMFEDIASYVAGEKVGHLKILLFYSISAVSYHFLMTMKITFNGIEEVDTLMPVREGCKGLACMSLTVFMFWMSHEDRKLRCWFYLYVMFWNVLALVSLELIEETFEHGNSNREPLQLYALPLAIDFKIYVLIHTYSDIVAARNGCRQELRGTEHEPLV
ncbi:Hypothetical predicted protein [Paramuricea clavata]|uniref:Uncharacterized protein n=2 Tax=Paramuricea clavata TaxID=317549 RepID=A0A7D9HTA7_PARCT|nr:Hypothetical predicted protein [Paramuricea clavata]